MRQILKKIAFPFLNTWYQRKTNKVNYYSNYGIRLKINPGVFHPGVFLSTNIFILFFKSMELTNKKVLELGAGSGMISFYIAQKEGIVTATDINKNAIKGLEENAISNDLPITVVTSDLFENVSPNEFDAIFINPPYYSKNPENEKQQAFYCGENYEYFRRLFFQLNQKWNIESSIYMILSEDCEINKIRAIGEENNIILETKLSTKKRGEENYIFKLKRHE